MYNNNPTNWENYKVKRNNVVNLLKTKKEQFYLQKIDLNKNNPCLMWKTLKSLTSTKSLNNNFVNGIKFESNDNSIKLVLNFKDIAEEFNHYFIDSIKQIISNIVTEQDWTSLINVPSSFTKFRLINLYELSKIINELDNKFSPMEVLNGKLLKSTFGVIGHVLLHFINISLEYG
ncbi:hypothetical protein NQ314_007277 [Rhamnusium bicolor]|uniref:Uncharacterized protein n=1 Tax=Rhamnusium bicolor TaxID=1586634 RepID=A0AAV8YSP8_9CUCU|nr:hypothetical protein NQ314_007277 [Rhamnusium bicolor]